MPTCASVTAIIVSYNSASVIGACIKALCKAGVQVLVVDNASVDDTVAVAEEAGAKVIANPRNEGYGRANNIGAQAASTEYLLFINPDAVASPEAVQTLLDAAENTADAKLFAPVLQEPDGKLCREKDGVLGTYLSGACLLVQRQVFLDMGGFDANIFLFYEDDDLSRRFRDAGLGIRLVDAATVAHVLGGSSGGRRGGRGQYVVRYHQAWSRFYIAHKYGVQAALWPWLAKFAGKYLIAMLTCNRSRRMRYSGSFMGAWDYARGISALEKQGLKASTRQER